MIGNNLNNVREVSRYVRNKEREYLKGKINELAMNITDLYRRINEFKRVHQPRSKNGIFCDVRPRSSCKNRCFGGT
jgi:hypothetical protein